MNVGYVVLYVDDAVACRRFWMEQVGMVFKRSTPAGAFDVVQVGFADQNFALELVPRALMEGNPDGIDMATPSMCFHVDDLAGARERLLGAGVAATEINDHCGTLSFAFPDPEGRWFAVTARP